MERVTDQVVGDTQPKKKIRHPDRITLSPNSLARLSDWIDQIKEHRKGINVTRSDLVNALIKNHLEKLSQQELKQFEQEFFDEARFAKWALKEILTARTRGENLTLSQLIEKQKSGRSENTVPKARKQKSSNSSVNSIVQSTSTKTDTANQKVQNEIQEV